MSAISSAHITSETTLIPAINGWELFLEDQGRSPHTIKAFSADMRILAQYLPLDRYIGSITTNDLNNFLEWMKNERGVPCSPKTYSRRITSIKSFFKWMNSAGVIAINPAEKVVQKSVLSPLPKVLTPDEIEAVLTIADEHRSASKPDFRYYTLAALLLSTAIKKGECLNLSPNHIHLDDVDKPLLFVRYPNPQYRYKERKISLTADWVRAYEQYSAHYSSMDKPLMDKLFPWSPRRLEYLLEDLSDQAGLDKHLSFDMCRWTAALTDWREGMERNKIRQKLGVSKVQWREIRMKLGKIARAEGAGGG
jgi:integrase/recombinase XerD